MQVIMLMGIMDNGYSQQVVSPITPLQPSGLYITGRKYKTEQTSNIYSLLFCIHPLFLQLKCS